MPPKPPIDQERPFFGSLNHIKFMVENSCDDTWDLVVELGLPALGKAMYVLIVPSPGEILENYLQPRPRRDTRKNRHRQTGTNGPGRAGVTRTRLPNIIPDVDSLIANMIPGRDFFEGRNAGKPERWIWTGIDILDRLAWWWLLIDVGENFIHYWSSNIMQSKFCTASFEAILKLRAVRNGLNLTRAFWGEANTVNVFANKGWVIQNNSNVARASSVSRVKGILLAEIAIALDRSSNQNPSRFHLETTVFEGGGVNPVYFSPSVNIEQGQEIAYLNFELEVQNCSGLRFQLATDGGFLNLPVLQSILNLTFLADPIP